MVVIQPANPDLSPDRHQTENYPLRVMRGSTMSRGAPRRHPDARGGESEEEYLSRCAADPVAVAIKRADLADKHFRGDAQVDQETAERLGQEAQERLELLDLLARARKGPNLRLVLSRHPPDRG